MIVNDNTVTKVHYWVRNKLRKGIKPKAKTLNVGEAIPVKTLGWARNLKSQLNAETSNNYEFWLENGRFYIGRIS